MKLLFQTILLFASLSFKAQEINPTLVTQLPTETKEASGIELESENELWINNDSGDQAAIYKVDTLGNLLRTLWLDIPAAIDFEELAKDIDGNFYIGDFGNNSNSRTDLVIYKIPPPSTISGDSVTPESIYFHYPDQTNFPASSDYLNFDCEAMFHFEDTLYLISKNRSSNYAKLYLLPDVSGTYTAILRDSIYTPGWVTAADINPETNMLSLLSGTSLQLIYSFSGNDFFNGTSIEKTMPLTQKEGIVFKNEFELLIVDEQSFFSDGNLYTFNTEDILSVKDNTPIDKVEFQVYFSNPKRIIIECNKALENIASGQVINLSGKLLHEFTLNSKKTEIPIHRNLTSNELVLISIHYNSKIYSYKLGGF